MSPLAVDAPALAARLPRARRRAVGPPLTTGGLALAYLSFVVLIPLAALAAHAGNWRAATNPEGLAALKLTLALAGIVVGVNALTGTALAWVLVRDRFPGQALVNSLVDLPFALPTIVAGLTLLTLYGPTGGVGVDIAFTRAGILLALLFVTLPFVVRTVQPVLLELDRDMEEAAASLGRPVDGDLSPNRLSEPAAGDPLRRRARVRARRRRVRRRRPHLREPAVQDRGRVGLHLRTDPVERRRGRSEIGRAHV